MRISIARALKERSRLAGKINEVYTAMSEENSMLEGAFRSVDIHAKFEEYKNLTRKIIILKGGISQANSGIAVELAELAETKSMINQLKELPTAEGKKRNFSDDSEYMMTAIIGKGVLAVELDALRNRANELQDRIDEFNASTFFEVEL